MRTPQSHTALENRHPTARWKICACQCRPNSQQHGQASCSCASTWTLSPSSSPASSMTSSSADLGVRHQPDVVDHLPRAHGDPDLHGRAVDDAARPGEPHHEPHRGSVQVPYTAFNVAGESWTYFYGLSIGLEVLVLAFILRYAWTWPRRTASPATLAASLDSEPLRTPQQA